MAEVINIRACCLDDRSDEMATLGRCSGCESRLIAQPSRGFPTVCPFCGQRLDNGTDDREWVRQIIRRAKGNETKAS